MADEVAVIEFSEVVKYLDGVKFPMRRRALYEAARLNGAPQEILDLIMRLPGLLYRNSEEMGLHFGHLDF
jgi:hypothetical protein